MMNGNWLNALQQKFPNLKKLLQGLHHHLIFVSCSSLQVFSKNGPLLRWRCFQHFGVANCSDWCSHFFDFQWSDYWFSGTFTSVSRSYNRDDTLWHSGVHPLTFPSSETNKPFIAKKRKIYSIPKTIYGSGFSSSRPFWYLQKNYQLQLLVLYFPPFVSSDGSTTYLFIRPNSSLKLSSLNPNSILDDSGVIFSFFLKLKVNNSFKYITSSLSRLNNEKACVPNGIPNVVLKTYAS